MLNRKMKIDDIIDYINKLTLLSLNEGEMIQITQILSLKELINSNAIRSLIAEDLKDEKWLEDTLILINTCEKKLQKTELIKNHINDFKNFIVYRFLEDKLLQSTLEVIEKDNKLELYIVESKNNKFRWMQKKFLDYFENSQGFIFLQSELKKQEHKKIVLTLSWLYSYSNSFFNSDIFNGIK